jgi:hypothetical protein
LQPETHSAAHTRKNPAKRRMERAFWLARTLRDPGYMPSNTFCRSSRPKVL